MQIARIRLSDKISRLHPRWAAAELGQAYEPEVTNADLTPLEAMLCYKR